MKAVKSLLACFLMLIIFAVPVLAEENDDFTSLINSSGADELYESLDDEIKDALGELGINGVDFTSLFDVSLEKVFNVIKNAASGSLESPVKSLTKLLSVIILLAIGESFIPDDEKIKPVMGILGSLFCISVVIVPLYQAMESAVSSVSLCSSFMKLLIPVLTGVISASGNPSLAISFQSVAFYAAQVISLVSEKYIVPLVGAVIALDIAGSLMPSFKLGGITELIKKTVVSVLSFAASLYVSFLGIKGALANAADTVANKGIKLIISSAVPVVGGAVSEAYSGILGSLVLVKSTVGIFGIAVIAVITAPAMIQLLFWIFALKIGVAAGEVFMQDGTVKILKAFASAATLLNVVLLFNAVLFIISMALILAIRQ
ncbi:MAG: hypothetical protein IJZ88_08555 [Clostridia bacterium]|nr:hypothetical protein [Clostridia bacterium]